MKPASPMRIVLGAALAAIATGSLAAQGAVAEHKFKDRRIALAYDAVAPQAAPGALAPGAAWPSLAAGAVLNADLPLASGEVLIAPGEYRVAVARKSAEVFVLRVEGAALPFGVGGAEGAAGDALECEGRLVPAKAPASTVAAAWSSPDAKKGDRPAAPLTLSIAAGADQLEFPFTVLLPKNLESQGWDVDLYRLPKELGPARFDAGKLMLLATLRRTGKELAKRGPLALNLVLGKQGMGFVAPLAKPASPAQPTALDRKAQSWQPDVKWAKLRAPIEGAEARTCEVMSGHGFKFKVACGDQQADLFVADPHSMK